MKRSLDAVVAAVGLVLALPLFVLIAVAVKFDSPGPILFRQERVGLGGRHFQILKFRSMRPGGHGLSVTSSRDSRITRVGRWLRATKLDELPQLINVLRGDMSLVGPRPEVPHYVAFWPVQARKEILSVRPGITDPASIEFRREAELLAEAEDPHHFYTSSVLPAKVALYRRYVAEQSLTGDVGLIVQTLRAVVRD